MNLDERIFEAKQYASISLSIKPDFRGIADKMTPSTPSPPSRETSKILLTTPNGRREKGYFSPLSYNVNANKEWLLEVFAGPSRAIVPIAIVGGTASVYSSALKSYDVNASQVFTPTSMLYLLLLALNYAIMPRLSKRYIHPNADKRSVALAEEVVKMTFGLGGWIIANWMTTECGTQDLTTCPTGGHSEINTIASSIQLTYRALSKQLTHWSPQSTLIAAGIPSLLYAIQGTLTYTAYQHLDPVTFNGMMQFKVLSSALGCYLVMGQTLSGAQLATLGLLMISTLVFQGSWKELLWDRWVMKSKECSVEENSKWKRGCEINNHDCNGHIKNNFFLGVLPCIGATLLSGLAGAFSQRSLQTFNEEGSMMNRDAYFYTVEVSFLSAVCLVVSLTFHCWRENFFRQKKRCDLEDKVFFRHWNYGTLLPIATKATAGVLTALVHRHLGSVIKGFALVLGLVFSALLQFVLEGRDLTAEQLVGTMLVLLSSWLHFKNPAK